MNIWILRILVCSILLAISNDLKDPEKYTQNESTKTWSTIFSVAYWIILLTVFL